MAKAKKKAARKKPAAKKRKKSTALAKRSKGRRGGKKSGKKKSSGKKKRAAKKSSRKKSRGKKSHAKKSSKHRGGWAKANRARKPDAVLAEVAGDKSGSSFNLVKRVWRDIKRKKIKKAKDRKGRHTVLLVGKDAALKKFAGGKEKLSMFHIGKQIKKHLVRSKKVANTGLVKRRKGKR